MIPKRLLPKFLRDTDTRVSTDLERIRHLPEGPLKMAKFALWWTRKTIFSKRKPDNPAFFVSMREEVIVEMLGGEYFEPGWELSYSYRNETLNLRRVEYVPDHPEHPDFTWWQVHIRGYHHGPEDGFAEATFELAPHFELEPTEYPRQHVEHVGLEIRRGAKALKAILDAHNVDYVYRYPSGKPANIDDRPLSSDGASTAATPSS